MGMKSPGANTGPAATHFGMLAIQTCGMEASVDCVSRILTRQAGGGATIGYLNPFVYNCACRDDAIRAYLERCDLVCIDGVGIVIAGRLAFAQSLERVVATALFEAIIDRFALPRTAVLIGTTAAEAFAAAEAINRRSNGLEIVGFADGYRQPDDYRRFLSRHSNVDAVLIGAGTPTSIHISLLASAVCPGALNWSIGAGTIKIFAGTKAQSPAWLSRIGCEWLHRCMIEPHVRSRIFPGVPEFVGNIARSLRNRQEDIPYESTDR